MAGIGLTLAAPLHCLNRLTTVATPSRYPPRPVPPDWCPSLPWAKRRGRNGWSRPHRNRPDTAPPPGGTPTGRRPPSAARPGTDDAGMTADPRPLLAAALIVRDEAAALPDCLASLAGVVDEIHV